jgi:hypothetical protein
VSKAAALALAFVAFALGGLIFHNPPPPDLPVLTEQEKAILAEVTAAPGPRAEVCERIFEMVLDAAHEEGIDEALAREN